MAGLSSVERAIIRQIDDVEYPHRPQFQILAEGTNLLDIFGISGVDGHRTTTNHIMETERVLGIEAARSRIISEIEETMIAFGIFVDHRHTMLLADCMTYKVCPSSLSLNSPHHPISFKRCPSWQDQMDQYSASPSKN